MNIADNVAPAQHGQAQTLPSNAEDSIMSDAEPNVCTTDDGVKNEPQLSQHKLIASMHKCTSTGSRMIEEVEDDSIMTEAELPGTRNSNSPARPYTPATVPCLEGEVLDQAKGPPPPESGRDGRPVRRQDHGNLEKYNGDTVDASSKA